MTFYFNGKVCEAREGDTVAAALYRAGQRIFTRSFKFHRPRGPALRTRQMPELPHERGRIAQHPELRHSA